MWIVNRISTDCIHTVSRLFFTARRAVHRAVHNLCNIFVNNMLFYISSIGHEEKCPYYPHVPCVDNIKAGNVQVGLSSFMYGLFAVVVCPQTPHCAWGCTAHVQQGTQVVDWTGVLATRSVRSPENGYGNDKMAAENRRLYRHRCPGKTILYEPILAAIQQGGMGVWLLCVFCPIQRGDRSGKIY